MLRKLKKQIKKYWFKHGPSGVTSTKDIRVFIDVTPRRIAKNPHVSGRSWGVTVSYDNNMYEQCKTAVRLGRVVQL